MDDFLEWEMGSRIWYPLIDEPDSDSPGTMRYEQTTCPECGKAIVCWPMPFETTMLPFRFAHEDATEGLLDPTFTRKSYMSISGHGPMRWGVQIDPVAAWKDAHGRQFAREYHNPLWRGPHDDTDATRDAQG